MQKWVGLLGATDVDWSIYSISQKCFCFEISEYLDEDMLIPKNTSVLIRRIPGQPRMPIVAAPVSEQPEYSFKTFKFF